MLNAFVSTLAFILADAAAAPPAPAAAEPAPAVVSTKAVAAKADSAERASNRAERPAEVALAETAPAVREEKALAFADRSDEKVAADVLAYLEGLTTLSGQFVQTAPNGAVATGEFYLRRPGQIRFDYDDPSPITIVATGGLVYVENADLETTDSYPLKKTPLRFLLSKKIEIGDATLKSVERAADAVAVTYVSNEEETEGEITLVLSAPKLSIEEWAIRDPQGGVTVVSLQGAVEGSKLENRLFRAPEAGGAFINN
ncbi:MAG TPA: outer membrane lipoprotein carrier protein LolA [Parvularculaceae bacterium]|nr:outer membrane lipoprotein carrier protein LolA [Parvularculaceae bacterium]